MDPNQALKELRQAVEGYEEATKRGLVSPIVDAADRMRDAIEALDEWLSKKGFPPADWKHCACTFTMEG